MGRPKKVDRPRKVEVQVPDSIYSAVQAELYSEIEGKIPFGALSNLATELFVNWLRHRRAAPSFSPTIKQEGDIVL